MIESLITSKHKEKHPLSVSDKTYMLWWTHLFEIVFCLPDASWILGPCGSAQFLLALTCLWNLWLFKCPPFPSWQPLTSRILSSSSSFSFFLSFFFPFFFFFFSFFFYINQNYHSIGFLNMDKVDKYLLTHIKTVFILFCGISFLWTVHVTPWIYTWLHISKLSFDSWMFSQLSKWMFIPWQDVWPWVVLNREVVFIMFNYHVFSIWHQFSFSICYKNH